MSPSYPVAIVTGAGRGLGAAAAHALGQAGQRVVLCDIELPLAEAEAAAIRAAGGEAVALGHDISKPAETDPSPPEPLQHETPTNTSSQNP